MGKSWILCTMLVLTLTGLAGASPQADVVGGFERLATMLDVGVPRAEIQKQLVDLKMSLDKLPQNAFAAKAADLFEDIRLGFLLADNFPTKKSGVALANESLVKKLPELKALAGAGKKKK